MAEIMEDTYSPRDEPIDGQRRKRPSNFDTTFMDTTSGRPVEEPGSKKRRWFWGDRKIREEDSRTDDIRSYRKKSSARDIGSDFESQQQNPPSSQDNIDGMPLRDSEDGIPDSPTTTMQRRIVKPIEIDPRDSKHDPIHYNFGKEPVLKKRKQGWIFGKNEKDDNEFSVTSDNFSSRQPQTRNDGDDDDDVPKTYSPLSDDFEQRRLRQRRREDVYEHDGDSLRRGQRREDGELEFASARRDITTVYQSTFNGRVALTLSCGMAGTIVGAFLGKSILNRPWGVASFCCGLFMFCTLLRNPYGELVRALGMTIILALSRFPKIRRRYPTWRHVQTSLGMADRQSFPPSPNPWNYEPRRDNDPEFRMLYTVIAMAFIGSTCGGNIPLIPTWIGSLAGAGFFGLSTTMNNARVRCRSFLVRTCHHFSLYSLFYLLAGQKGDLTRSMGMRLVALGEEIFGINTELGLLRKGGVVAGKVFDKILFLDRKHRIKDRLIAGASLAYDQVSSQMNSMQDNNERDVGRRAQPRDRDRSVNEDDRRWRPQDDAWRREPRDGSARMGRRDDFDKRR